MTQRVERSESDPLNDPLKPRGLPVTLRAHRSAADLSGPMGHNRRNYESPPGYQLCPKCLNHPPLVVDGNRHVPSHCEACDGKGRVAAPKHRARLLYVLGCCVVRGVPMEWHERKDGDDTTFRISVKTAALLEVTREVANRKGWKQ